MSVRYDRRLDVCQGSLNSDFLIQGAQPSVLGHLICLLFFHDSILDIVMLPPLIIYLLHRCILLNCVNVSERLVIYK